MKYKGFNLMSPRGYYILVEMDSDYVENDTDDFTTAKGGSILVSKKAVSKEHRNANTGIVIAMGPEAYNKRFHEVKGCADPWARVGDRVLVKAYSGFLANPENDEYVLGRFQYVTDEAIVAADDKEEE